MKRTILILIIFIAGSNFSFAQNKFVFSPLIQQNGMYYSSENVTSDGYGFGIGLNVLYKDHFAGQADVNLLWLNGNSVPVRIALGYQRKGKWMPAVYGTVNMIFGQRIEILDANGNKPPVPAWSFGIRITPLKFKTKTGYISALEAGYGIGPSKAMVLEVSLLCISVSL